MTAVHIIDDHNELTNIGLLNHQQLDTYITGSTFLVVSSSSGPLPPAARRLKAGAGVSITDEGPGGNLIINCTVTGSSGGNGGGLAVIAWMDVLSGLTDGANTLFGLNNVPTSPVMFFVNGALQTSGSDSDYTLAGATITATVAPRSGSNVSATYQYATTGSSTTIAWMERPTGANDGTNAAFSLAFLPNPGPAVMLFVNGILMTQGSSSDYVLVGNTVSLVEPPRSGSNINATYPHA